MEPKKTTNATEFVKNLDDLNLVNLMAALDAAGIPAAENWDTGAIQWTFPDRSKIRVSGMDYEVSER